MEINDHSGAEEQEEHTSDSKPTLAHRGRSAMKSTASYASDCVQKNHKATRIGLIVIIALLILWGASSLYSKSGFPKVDRSGWQAVFLTNNQVYFGHLKNYNREYIELSNIYYLRVSAPLQQPSTSEAQPQSNINLVKLGNELHGPQDQMFIPKDQILFWENLRPDSSVVQAISQSSQ